MIRKLERKDKENWIKLYCEYAKFYKVSMNNEILNTLWNWIHDKNNVVNGICYELERKLLELLIIERCQDQLRSYICFLDDLFVEPEFRGQK